jgi:GNAT superfamily N-acetyltransferase
MKNSTEYIIKQCSSQNDRKRLIDFNAIIHDEICGRLTDKIFKLHPTILDEHFFFIENSNKEIISSVALIPWDVYFGSVKLNVYELGIVGTRADYRGKGLSRSLTEHFLKYIDNLEYDMSIIQGIPGFYHNFGFHYAIPLDIHLDLPLYGITKSIEESGYILRKAVPEESGAIADFYKEHIKKYDLHTKLNSTTITYCMDCSFDSEYDAEYYFLNHNGNDIGYFKINLHGFGDGLIVSEVSDMDYSAYRALLVHCRTIALSRGMDYIRFNIPDFHSIVPVIKSCRGRHTICYAWQIRIEPIRFLKKIASILEHRVRKSILQSQSFTFRVDLYHYSLILTFTDGKFKSVEREAITGEFMDIFSMKEGDFFSLITGHETINMIMNRTYDCICDDENMVITQILFPKQNSFLYYNM